MWVGTVYGDFDVAEWLVGKPAWLRPGGVTRFVL